MATGNPTDFTGFTSDVNISNEKEFALVKQLKSLCDSRGREIDPTLTSTILHQLGLLLRTKTPDKLSLIQAATLINAALVRNKKGDEVLNDLHELYTHVLQLAGSAFSGKDLEIASETVYQKVLQMRSDTKEALNLEKAGKEEESNDNTEKDKIRSMQHLQGKVTDHFTSIMRSIAESCISFLGTPRCKFCLVGIGSVARREVTPYSDFECVIALEEGVQKRSDYSELLEYFRWFAVLFQLILVNFGETIIPSVAVPCLNDFDRDGGDWFYDVHTPRGICFDGFMPQACKSPLGRQRGTKAKPWKIELIQPVSVMVSFLESESDLKNGYHLSDILTWNHLVAGDNSVYDDFHSRVDQHMKNIGNEEVQLILNQIREDLESFAVFTNLSNIRSTKKINTKRVIYRSTTIFISTLGRLHGFSGGSSFEVIDELQRQGVITPEAAHNLRYAVAIACEVRLKVYMLKGGQIETTDNVPTHYQSEEIQSEVIQIVGIGALVKYFKIAFCLQRMVRNGPTDKMHSGNMMDVGLDVEANICYHFHQYRKTIECCSALRETYMSMPGHRDKMLACTSVIADCLFHLEKYEEALLQCQQELDFRLKSCDSEAVDIANSRKALGRCFFKLHRFDEALMEYKKELNIRKSSGEDIPFVQCLENLGMCLFKMGRYSEALDVFQQLLKAQDRSLSTITTEVAETLVNIAGCYFKLESFGEALDYYNQAKKKQATDDAEHVADCENKIAHCLYKMSSFDKALEAYQCELIINKNTDSISKQKIYDCYANLARCFFELKQYEEALGCYQQILHHYEENSSVADYYLSAARCLLFLEKYDEALEYFSKQLDVIDIGSGSHILCLHGTASALRKLGRSEKAITMLKEELTFHEQPSRGPSLDEAKCYNLIASCCIDMENYGEAQKHYEKELEVRKQLKQDSLAAESIADCMHNIACCLYKLGNTDEAMKHLAGEDSFRKKSIVHC